MQRLHSGKHPENKATEVTGNSEHHVQKSFTKFT